MITPKSFGNRLLPNETIPSSQISMLEPYISTVKPWLRQNLSETASQMERFLLPRFPCWNLTCLSWNHDNAKIFRKPPPPKWNDSFFPDIHAGTLHIYSETMIKTKSFGNRLPNETLPSSQISVLEPYMSIVKPWLSQNLSEFASQMKRFLLPRFLCWNLTCLQWNHD